jgi:hypothetical protein
MVTADRSSHALRSAHLEVVFGENPLRVERIAHHPSGQVVSPGGEQQFLIRMPKAPSDPIFLREVEDVVRAPGLLAFTLRDASGHFTIQMRIEAGENGLDFQMTASGTEPLLMAEWVFEGLALDGLVLVSPVLDFGWWTQAEHTPWPAVAYRSVPAGVMARRRGLWAGTAAGSSADRLPPAPTANWAISPAPGSAK